MEPNFPQGRRVRVQYGDLSWTVTLEDGQGNKTDSEVRNYRTRSGVVVDRMSTDGGESWLYKIEFKSGHRIYWIPECYLQDATLVGQLY